MPASLELGVFVDSYRLKMKIGAHEFEADGDPIIVQAQFEAFKELVTAVGTQPPPRESDRNTDPNPTPRPDPVVSPDGALEKIMKIEDRIVSLTAGPATADDAALLILFGQKALRGSDSVTGYEVMQGLTVSGQRLPRVDRILEKAAKEGNVIVIGQGRGKRYRLTNSGLTKGRAIANSLLATIA